MKIVSAGLILSDGISFLGCKITGQDIYDIPKGKIDGDETPLEACIREVLEETGIIVNKLDLIDLGLYKYTPTKDLHLFYLFVDKLPDVDKLWCSTYFTHPKSGREIPEINGYLHVALNDYKLCMGKSMNLTLENVFNEYEKYFTEDGYLYLLAQQRLKNGEFVSKEEVLEQFGITEEDLDIDVDIE